MACLTNNAYYVFTHYKICTRVAGALCLSYCMNSKLFQNTQHKAQARLSNTNSSDALDNFAEKLVQEKNAKWELLKSQRNPLFSKDHVNTKQDQLENEMSTDFYISDPYEYVENYETYSLKEENELDNIIKKLVEREDILAVLQNCSEHKCCPSSAILLELASKFARVGDKSGIEAIQTICKQSNTNEYENQAGYQHFMAEATWVRGNLASSLELFLCVYKNHISLRRKVRSMIKYLMENVVTCRSEAQLVTMTKFAIMMGHEYGDFTILAFLWQYCFVSEWFSDQELARELLEEHTQLVPAVMERIAIITMKSLQQHKPDIVQRLLETLLRFDMKLQYGQVLRVYFDYRCYQGDLRSCSAIIQSSLELNVTLTSSQHQKFLSLFLDQKHRRKWMTKFGRSVFKHPPSVKPFQFKF